MKIRLANPNDVKEILPMFRELDKKHYENGSDIRSSISDDRYFLLFNNFFREKSNLIITVVENNQCIIAFAISKITIIKNNLLFEDSTIGEILYLTVDKNYKRKGIATQIMSDMEERLRMNGVTRLEAKVFSFNDETIPEKIKFKAKYTVYEKYI